MKISRELVLNDKSYVLYQKYVTELYDTILAKRSDIQENGDKIVVHKVTDGDYTFEFNRYKDGKDTVCVILDCPNLLETCIPNNVLWRAWDEIKFILNQLRIEYGKED
jgi:hypothetical protein